MKIAISAGDPSGDEHGAKIVNALQTLHPNCELFGMGGSHLRAAGMETVIDSERDASVMGSTEVLMALPRLWRAFNQLVQEIERRKPDVVLLVDYQEFNILLAKRMKARGIKTFFYIAPSVWAWRAGRVKNFIKYVDHLAVIYPFEPKFFKDAGYEKLTYVGHPLADDMAKYNVTPEERTALRSNWSIPTDATVTALFPGSRTQEIRRHVAPMKEAFQIAQKEIPDLYALIPVPSSIEIDTISELVADTPAIRCVRGDSIDVLRASDVGLIKSGTSNLQAALVGLPFTMVYQANLVTEMIVRMVFERRVFSIVNIIRSETVREIIQEKVTGKVLGEELLKLLTDEKYREGIQNSLGEVSELMKSPGKDSAEVVAELVLELSGKPVNKAPVLASGGL